jgi:hypothetical protein
VLPTRQVVASRSGQSALARCPDIDLKLIRWYVVVRGVMGIAAVGRVRLCPDARPLRSTAKAG